MTAVQDQIASDNAHLLHLVSEVQRTHDAFLNASPAKAGMHLRAYQNAQNQLTLWIMSAVTAGGYRLMRDDVPAAPAPARSTRVKAQPARLRLTTQQRAALEELRRERIAIHSDKPNRTLQSLIDRGLVYCGYQRRIDGLGPAEWRLSLTEDGRAALRGRS